MKKTTRLGSDGEGAVLIGEHQQHPLAPRGALCSRFILLSTEHTALPQLRGFEKARGRGTLPKHNEKGKHKMEREIWPNATGRGGRRRSHGLSFPALCATCSMNQNTNDSFPKAFSSRKSQMQPFKNTSLDGFTREATDKHLFCNLLAALPCQCASRRESPAHILGWRRGACRDARKCPSHVILCAHSKHFNNISFFILPSCTSQTWAAR